MKILLIATHYDVKNLRKQFPDKTEIYIQNGHREIDFSAYQYVFDQLFDQDPSIIRYYSRFDKTIFILNTVCKSLAQTYHDCPFPRSLQVLGANLFTGFVEGPVLECSRWNQFSETLAAESANLMGKDYLMIEDRVGMVRPRIIAQLVNEACFTVQEGTASQVDIDLAMRLGVNYPEGPFQWADKIGIEKIFRILESLYADTHDERFKISPFLKRKFLLKEPFFPQ